MTGESNMEIRHQSKTGPFVPSLDEIKATLSRQNDEMKLRLLDWLNRDPASLAQIEVGIHDCFRRLTDQMTASLLAETTISDDRAEPEKKGALR
jgi:hypothetical protein